MVAPLLALAASGAGLLAGRTLNRRRQRQADNQARAMVDVLLAGEEDGQLPPVPLEMQEARGTSVITPLEARLAATMSPQDAAQSLLQAAGPRIEERRQERARVREMARQDALLMDPQRAHAESVMTGQEFFRTYDERVQDVVAVPVAGSKQWQSTVDALEGQAQSLDAVNRLIGGYTQLAGREDFGTLQFLDSGDPQIAGLQTLAATVMQTLRKAWATGTVDEGTLRLFEALGLDLGQSDIDNAGAFMRLLQANPAATVERLRQLGGRLQADVESTAWDQALFRGVNPATRALAADSVATYQQLAALPQLEAGPTAFRTAVDSDGGRAVVEGALGLITDEDTAEAVADSLLGRAPQAAPAPAQGPALGVGSGVPSSVGRGRQRETGSGRATQERIEAFIEEQLLFPERLGRGRRR